MLAAILVLLIVNLLFTILLAGQLGRIVDRDGDGDYVKTRDQR